MDTGGSNHPSECGLRAPRGSSLIVYRLGDMVKGVRSKLLRKGENLVIGVKLEMVQKGETQANLTYVG